MIISPSGHIKTTEDDNQPIAFLRMAFRPLFWLGALFSVFSILVWGLTLTGYIQFSPMGGAYFWHVHEMLFGFVVAIITGFLLTAVQTWTGVSSVKGKTLFALVMVWLLARVFNAFPVFIPENLIIALDVLYLPLAAYYLANPVIKAKKWRNLFFVPVLCLMGVLNLLMHLAAKGVLDISFISISHIMVLMVTLIMCIMGGRVFPMFTSSGTKTERLPAIGWLEKLSIISVVLSVLVVAQILPLHIYVEAAVLLIAGVINFIRALRWKIWVTLKTPLVWSLHLSYWSICIGLVMLGLAKLGSITGASLGIHAITVGGMGLMILAMISRVSLGHTGRIMQVNYAMSFALMLMVLALIVRVFMPMIIESYQMLILIACVLWALAFGSFVVVYFPVLFSPRVDGDKG
ncbi:NnrS family protein [Marinicellulosiphila megalodicopiae]|uniref:NnrS family protein n=1 Tax=Marinicellulosiphila megalodicopiae TaxID=2724896 RepID=UPI003BAF2668